MSIQTVTIVGVGLIGGSFGSALRKYGFKGRILGVSSGRTLKAAVEIGAIDEGVSLEQGVARADLVYLSQPISGILEVLPQVRQRVREGALVTDAGSTKEAIVGCAAGLFSESPWFVGGHPMAGKEQRGVERADPDLFRGATYVLTPLGGELPQAPIVEEFVEWIGGIGARAFVLPASLHDEIVTWTSHLPQLVSSALAAAVAGQLSSEDHGRVAGPGLQDMTRLAGSPYEIWRDIFSTNRSNVDRALGLFIERLQEFRRRMPENGLEKEFQEAQASKQKLQAGRRA
jgi:prephenate dehydrogenase